MCAVVVAEAECVCSGFRGERGRGEGRENRTVGHVNFHINVKTLQGPYPSMCSTFIISFSVLIRYNLIPLKNHLTDPGVLSILTFCQSYPVYYSVRFFCMRK